MTLHRSALLFYLPFPTFYCSTLSPFHCPNSRFTLSSFHLSNIQKDILISYSFTFLTSKKLVLNFYPSIFLPSKLSFFTFNPSPFHHPNRHFSLFPLHHSTFKQPHLIGHPLLWRGLGRLYFYNLISLNEVPDINLSRSTCPFMPRTLPRSVNCHMLCLPAPFISGRRELYFPRKRKYVLKRGARCEL